MHDSCSSLDGSYGGTPSRRVAAAAQNMMSDRSWTAGTRVRDKQPVSLLQRHNSGENIGIARPHPPLHSNSLSGGSAGPRQRAGTLSPFPTKRNLSGDFDGSTTSPVPPYGMLNPGKSHYSMHHSHGHGHGHGHAHHSKNYQGLLSVHHWRNNQKQVISFFGFCTLFLLGTAVYQHDAMLQEALQLKEQEVDHHLLHAKELEKRLQTMRHRNQELEEKLEKEQGEPKVDLQTQRKIFHLEHNQLKMQQDIQLMSKRIVKERFGHGPRYYVQMKLEFDPNSNVYKDVEAGDEIILETASIDDMPHSVYLFLEQVDHNLFDHTTFHRNAAHLVQAGPSVNTKAHTRFRHHPSLNSVIFQEYAPEMTHKQYTLGYSGRPGGPDFYVNLRDNSAINGPGGQHTHYSDIILDADPCFAKFVKGFEAIERVHRSQVVDGDMIVHPVVIASMKVLPPDYVFVPSASSDSGDVE